MSPDGARFMKEEIQNSLACSKDPSEITLKKHLAEGKDVIILNVWRPLCVVEDNPLGLCKWKSPSEEECPNWGTTPTNPSNAIQAWRYMEDQEWFYLSKQKPDEVYVFLQHDSRAEDKHGINVPHASFMLEDDHRKLPTRSSFECRVIAIVES
ncbi:uncharacterized protein MELLADRAFT_53163 [Melampsora larici-populina 98AG31]|uniref:Uncharacterized protein n=1 Tax=Melampsora larici-populina (strain 98AG31 / pathotype 3-4-7) TaxID=747676 RepID=F4RV20_MELLP|nr:uncharacterized protein MELLADRAFT_53163 [Melampsora larici-populina 98AG31]EGG03831.1 hypothetical protein MELLADRAFT_53163 [Melampsora larici-populina 98AG31]